jgi:uncharacterized membrane protein YhiD involved in acid resistance
MGGLDDFSYKGTSGIPAGIPIKPRTGILCPTTSISYIYEILIMRSVLMIFAVVLVISTVTTSAQSKATQQERLKNLKQRLQLTEEQYTKVEQIITKTSDELQKLRSSGNPDREDFMKIRDESNEEVLQVLDETQKAEFNKMLDERGNFRQRETNKNNH